MTSSPETMEVFLRTQADRQERDLRPDLALAWMLGFVADHQIATEPPDVCDTLIVDEGFTQRSVSLLGAGYLETDDRVLLDGYLASAPLPDILVVVTTTFEECFARLEARGWSKRVEGLSLATGGGS